MSGECSQDHNSSLLTINLRTGILSDVTRIGRAIWSPPHRARSVAGGPACIAMSPLSQGRRRAPPPPHCYAGVGTLAHTLPKCTLTRSQPVQARPVQSGPVRLSQAREPAGVVGSRALRLVLSPK
jgi:hypothetical protein